MFDNVGEKIKKFATTLAWLGISLSLLFGIVFIAVGEGSDSSVAIGLTVMIAGPLSSWISSLLLYGFGQLITNSDLLVKQGTKTRLHPGEAFSSPPKTEQKAPAQTNTTPTTPAPTKEWADKATFTVTENETIICTQCNYEQPKERKVCWHCGARFENNK